MCKNAQLPYLSFAGYQLWMLGFCQYQSDFASFSQEEANPCLQNDELNDEQTARKIQLFEQKCPVLVSDLRLRPTASCCLAVLDVAWVQMWRPGMRHPLGWWRGTHRRSCNKAVCGCSVETPAMNWESHSDRPSCLTDQKGWPQIFWCTFLRGTKMEKQKSQRHYFIADTNAARSARNRWLLGQYRLLRIRTVWKTRGKL